MSSSVSSTRLWIITCHIFSPLSRLARVGSPSTPLVEILAVRAYQSTLRLVVKSRYRLEKLGTNLKFETTHALPDGDDCCRRRFWVEPTE